MVFVLAILLLFGVAFVRDPYFAVWRSQNTVKALAKASLMYYEQYQKWPASLTNIVYTGAGERARFQVGSAQIRDAWGRYIIYEPFDKAKGYGSVKSLGSDGKGDLGEELEVRFQ